jgi:hypothetical protein
VRALIKDAFEIEQDTDITTKDGADLTSVNEYNTSIEGANGPVITSLRIDMIGEIDSLWNVRVIELLVKRFRDAEDEFKEEWDLLPTRLNAYIQDMVKSRIKRLRTVWRNAQPKVKENGELETEKEWEERVTNSQLDTIKNARQLTRRGNVSEEP